MHRPQTTNGCVLVCGSGSQWKGDGNDGRSDSNHGIGKNDNSTKKNDGKSLFYIYFPSHAYLLTVPLLYCTVRESVWSCVPFPFTHFSHNEPRHTGNWLNIFNIRYSSSWNRHLHAFDTYNTEAKYMFGINTKEYGFVIHAFALLLLRLSLLSQSYWVRMRIETHTQTQPSRCDDDIAIAK